MKNDVFVDVSRYLTEITLLLLEDSENLDSLLRGANRPIAVLFSDIQGFTTLSEQYAPEPWLHI